MAGVAPGGSTASTKPESSAAIQLSCRNVWKVFGPHPERVLGGPDVELSRAELMAKTGCTIAAHDISFDVAHGEVFVIMGLSGSGKSTLVRCATRLVEPTSGSITICGQDVVGADAKALRSLRREKVAMVFQHFGLFPHRTALDNVAYGLEVQGVDRAKRYERAREVLGIVGLSHVEGSYPDQLSGGMQQRVGLARALAVDPEVLVFDEAFSALDPLIRREMQDEVLRLQARLRKTVLFVTHDLDEALKLGDRIAIMKDGRFVQVGTPAEIVGAPADDYVREFVRDVPRGKVLTAAFATRPLADEGPPTGTVRHDETLGELLPVVFGARGPIGVVDGQGELVGILDRRMVIHVLAGHEGVSVPEEPGSGPGERGPGETGIGEREPGERASAPDGP